MTTATGTATAASTSGSAPGLAVRLARGVVGVVREALVGYLTMVLLAVVVLGLALVPVLGLGVPLLLETAGLVRRSAAAQRARVGRVLRVDVPDPHPPLPEGSLWSRAAFLARRPATWRDVLWLGWQSVVPPFVALVLGQVVYVAYTAVAGGDTAGEHLAGTPLALVLLGVVVLLCRPLLLGHAVVCRRLLAPPGHRSASAARIAELTRTRAGTVDAQAAELRRIERDLHDGVQARLVSLGLSVGLARTALHEDPARADALLDEVRGTIGTTLDELRALVRGIHPPVLAERGLPAALEALALGASVPVHTRIQDVGPLEAPVASALYFAAAEALTNVSRHAGASAAVLVLAREPGRVRLVVRDDGHGGADPGGGPETVSGAVSEHVSDTDPGAGTGLRGISDRLAAFDGTLSLTSPAGGPTELRLEVPCAP